MKSKIENTKIEIGTIQKGIGKVEVLQSGSSGQFSSHKPSLILRQNFSISLDLFCSVNGKQSEGQFK